MSRRDGELLVANDKKYSSKVFVGNWPGEKLVEDEKLKQFLEKRERGELLLQQRARLFETFLAPAQLSPTTYVSFDQAVQLIACDMPKIHSTLDRPLALSVVVNEPHINRCQEIDQHCAVTCASSASGPTARNSFIIRKPNPTLRHDRHRCNANEAANSKITADKSSDCQNSLKYGQEFMFECYDSKQSPLMLYSSPKSPLEAGHSDYVFKTHGEMKQSLGLALNQAYADGERLTDAHSVPSNFFLWRLFHINPDIRYETIGENVPEIDVINGRACVCRRQCGEFPTGHVALQKSFSPLFSSFIHNHLVPGLLQTPMIDHST